MFEMFFSLKSRNSFQLTFITALFFLVYHHLKEVTFMFKNVFFKCIGFNFFFFKKKEKDKL